MKKHQKRSPLKFLVAMAVAFTMVFASVVPAFAVTISLVAGQDADGHYVQVVVTPGAGHAGLNTVDIVLDWDTTYLTRGAIQTPAGWVPPVTVPTVPLRLNSAMLDVDPDADGSGVISTIRFTVLPGAPATGVPVTIEEVIAAYAMGGQWAATSVVADVTVDYSEGIVGIPEPTTEEPTTEEPEEPTDEPTDEPTTAEPGDDSDTDVDCDWDAGTPCWVCDRCLLLYLIAAGILDEDGEITPVGAFIIAYLEMTPAQREAVRAISPLLALARAVRNITVSQMAHLTAVTGFTVAQRAEVLEFYNVWYGTDLPVNPPTPDNGAGDDTNGNDTAGNGNDTAGTPGNGTESEDGTDEPTTEEPANGGNNGGANGPTAAQWAAILASPHINANGAGGTAPTVTATDDGLVVSSRGDGQHDNNRGLLIDVAALRALNAGGDIVITVAADNGISMQLQGIHSDYTPDATVTNGVATLTVPGDAPIALPGWANWANDIPFLGTSNPTSGPMVHPNFTVTGITVGGVCVSTLI
jgi:hypothetical protein